MQYLLNLALILYSRPTCSIFFYCVYVCVCLFSNIYICIVNCYMSILPLTLLGYICAVNKIRIHVYVIGYMSYVPIGKILLLKPTWNSLTVREKSTLG